MSRQSSLTQARLKELLKYDPETGVFTRAVTLGRWRKGTCAGTVGPNGYIRVGVDRVYYLAHRLAWLYVHGVWPPAEIDHINGIKDDNRIVNLRCATRSENIQNQRRPMRNNKLGVLGVSRNRDKFRACIMIAGALTYLGNFTTVEEAAQAYVEAKSKYHPFSPVANAS